jgi:integrase
MSIQLTLYENENDLKITEERLRLLSHSRAPRTLKGYASDQKLFRAWCWNAERSPLPASARTVALYITSLLDRGRKISTASRHVSAINYAHISAGFESPCTNEIYRLLEGAQRLRCEQPNQKAPITVAQLRAMVATIAGDDATRVRNRAILLFGFATALRRSTLVTLTVADLEWRNQGIVVYIRREKQDQLGRGRRVAVPPGRHDETCPVSAVREWLRVRGEAPGPLFARIRAGKVRMDLMHANTIARIIKAAIAATGGDHSLYAGHSLRAGFVTEAIAGGASEFEVAAQTGHRSLNTLRRYYRPQDPFRGNACRVLGL